jgi:hypothetical protein
MFAVLRNDRTSPNVCDGQKEWMVQQAAGGDGGDTRTIPARAGEDCRVAMARMPMPRKGSRGAFLLLRGDYGNCVNCSCSTGKAPTVASSLTAPKLPAPTQVPSQRSTAIHRRLPHFVTHAHACLWRSGLYCPLCISYCRVAACAFSGQIASCRVLGRRRVSRLLQARRRMSREVRHLRSPTARSQRLRLPYSVLDRACRWLASSPRAVW